MENRSLQFSYKKSALLLDVMAIMTSGETMKYLVPFGESTFPNTIMSDAIFQAATQDHMCPRKKPGGLLPDSDD